MAEDFGTGVSRTLSALHRQFQQVVWQQDKPPLDSELNLMAQIDLDRMQQLVRGQMHSGFLLDPTQAQRDFVTSEAWSNFFKIGAPAADETAPVIYANVNGWIVPVTGSAVGDGDPSNRVDLFPPPSSDSRIDFVFLEAWVCNVAPNPSALNKPAADTLWAYGNVKFGGTNITDDLEDPTVGFETTERIQIQYRLRVVGQGSGLGTSVDLGTYPDGLDDPNVLGQGTASGVVSGYSFTNMRTELGDAGLWRAGDGDANNDLGTLDGYTYAIPVAGVFRRNSSNYTSISSGGNPNQNGSLNRNPITTSITDPAEGSTIFATATLTNDIDETDTGSISVDNLTGSALANANLNWGNVFLTIDDEVFSISSVDTGAGTIFVRATNGRGRYGTMASPHAAGATIEFFNHRLDGLFADQVASTDILDLRRGVTLGEWDYTQLLAHNLSKLLRGELRSSYKQAGIGDTQGPLVVEVDTLLANGGVTVPNYTEALDGPDGIRTTFSDSASLETGVTSLLDDPSGTGPGFVTQFDSGTTWGIGAPIVPGGFVNDAGWSDGSVIFVHIGGAGGGNGARETFRDGSERAVRFVTPAEYFRTKLEGGDPGLQKPVTLRFTEEAAHIPAAGAEPATEHPGPYYPLDRANFEKPFCVLGGILNADSQFAGAATVVPDTGAGDWEVELPGQDFDNAGEWFSKTGAQFNSDPTLVTKPVLHDSRTLYSMITKNGTDRTGASSEVYLVIWGSTTNAANNGLFRVVGAGASAGYTTKSATASDRVRVEFVSGTYSDFVAEANLSAEFRSQYSHSADGDGFDSGQASMAIVLTDLSGTDGGSENPWNSSNLTAPISQPVASQAVLSTSVTYHPGRGGTARVADSLKRFAVVTAGSEYLRQSPTALDSTFPSASGVPSGETYFPLNPIQTWNRLSSLGQHAPEAPAYGGSLVNFTEQDRESELFVDAGSKTILFRPFQNKQMTLRQFTITAGNLIPTTYGTVSTDAAGIWVTAPVQTGYALPPEVMPRFGRQDIPFFTDISGTGAGTFLQGLNHLFTDTSASSDPQFNIIGGTDNSGSPGVNSIRFQTGSGSGLTYGEAGTIPGTSTQGLQGRLYEDLAVQSSDLGQGLRGIQLPPFYGVARIYGVYDLRDYVAAGGATFESDRITPSAGAPPNLLRSDASKQTVFIVQGGASDVTGDEDDHTYVVPQEAINIELSNSFISGETFSDLGYVVECCVFGFARGFINQNTFVLARRNNGNGNAADVDLDPVGMTIPAAAPINDQCYTAYIRTPYQGDPYMTRAGETRTVSDYENRYGQIDMANAFGLSTAIQQFDSTTGAQIPQIPNARSVQVLAAVDFYTTLGTGKVGGPVFAGTPLDVSYTTNDAQAATRIPTATTDPPFQVRSRAFTEGQARSATRGVLRAFVADNASMGSTSLSITANGSTHPLAFTVGGSANITATNIASAINSDVAVNSFVRAVALGSVIEVQALVPGDEGASVELVTSDPSALSLLAIGLPATATAAPLQGGLFLPTNAAAMPTAITPVKLTGLTERLPLGILLQDSDFIGEDPLRDGTSTLSSGFGVVSSGTPISVPLTGAEEYTRLVGGTGQFIGLADGAILQYVAYTDTQATGSRRFRLYRGGGSAYILSEPNPGGPVDWLAGSFPSNLQPVLKGGVLVGKALLVRNFPETAFSGGDRTSHGDEIQMVIMTRGYLGKGQEQNVNTALTGIVSPTGYGEGYAAADRYRLEGKPLHAGQTRLAPDPNIELAAFPFTDLSVNTEC